MRIKVEKKTAQKQFIAQKPKKVNYLKLNEKM
jgi:hypothetical protein